MYKYIAIMVAVLGLMPWVTTSCVKENQFVDDTSARLRFSTDTIAFDTVFTTMGTTTKVLMVYNVYDEAVRLDRVALKSGYASRFRLNVDGDTSMEVRNKVIAPHDSIFVFVKACINPNSMLEPFLVEDAICFEWNSHVEELPLTAYGRNAVYHNPTDSLYYAFVNEMGCPDTTWYPYSVIDCEGWDHTRPHVILGYGRVAPGKTLHLQPGETLYFGSNSFLWVQGTLDARGVAGRPVTFTSMRHDGYRDTLPGQWGYVWLATGSVDNVMDWARVENGTVGLLVDTNVNGNPTLTITNTVVENHSTAGIVGQGTRIEGDNVLVANCGVATMSLQYGGSYRFSNSTFANYWRYDTRKNPSLVLNNHYNYVDGNMVTVYPRDLRKAEFVNCIVYGNYTGLNGEGEIDFDAIEQAQFNVSFDHCLLRTGLLDSMDVPEARLLINRDPQFVNERGREFHLLPSSPAIGAGWWGGVTRTYDLDNRARSNPPTIGAYEYRDTSELKLKYKPNTTNATCTAISPAHWQKLLLPMRSSIARGSAISLRSPSPRTLKSKTRKR